MDTDKTSGDTGAEGKAGDVETDAATDATTRPEGPEPTRYGDWEQKGRCSDF